MFEEIAKFPELEGYTQPTALHDFIFELEMQIVNDPTVQANTGHVITYEEALAAVRTVRRRPYTPPLMPRPIPRPMPRPQQPRPRPGAAPAQVVEVQQAPPRASPQQPPSAPEQQPSTARMLPQQ